MNHDEQRGLLAEALQESSQVAQEAYEDAVQALKRTQEVIEVAERSLDESMTEIEKVERGEAAKRALREQRTELRRWLAAGNAAHLRELDARKARLQEFKLALFGRTMAGKSTLMEILTEGDGASIGKGQQRTTQDVRRYHWRGMQISDVPGVAAFGGEDDELLAMGEATQSDLVLFLFTDDAPQDREVEFYVQLRKMGKPIICLFNVKTNLNSDVGWMKFKKKKNLGFDKVREESFEAQLNAMVKAKLPTEEISFIPVHLLARIKSMDPNLEDREFLREQSRFSEAEAKITEVVRERGAFFRRKSFVDGAVMHTYEMSHKILRDAREQLIHKGVLEEGLRELQRLILKYQDSVEQRVTDAIDEVFSQIDIDGFVEQNLEKEVIKERWAFYLASVDIDESMERAIDGFMEEFRDQAAVVAEGLSVNIPGSSMFNVTDDIPRAEITDDKTTATMIGSTVGALGGIALLLVPFEIPLLAGLGVGAALAGLGSIMGGFFESEEEQRVKKTNELKKKIEDSVEWGKLKWKKELVSKLRDSFSAYSDSLKEQQQAINNMGVLINQQRALAEDIVAVQRTMNETLVTQALEQVGLEELFEVNRHVLRSPGSVVAFLVDTSWQAWDTDTSRLRALMGERTMVFPISGSWNDVAKILLGCPVETGANEVALLSPPTAEVKTRARLIEEWANVVVVHDGEVVSG